MVGARQFVGALAVVALLAALPAGADHAASCTDPYVCTSGGTVISVVGALTVEGSTVTVEAQRWTEQRFSSAGHLERDDVTATVTGADGESCSPDPATITFAGSNALEEIRVSATDPSCSFDLGWTPEGQPGAAVDRRTEASPGVPTMFTTIAIASGGLTISSPAGVSGSVAGATAEGQGTAREHRYAGHVTLIP